MSGPEAGMFEVIDDWQPAGGMLLDGGDDQDYKGEVRGQDDVDVWTDSNRPVEDVLSPGMLFGIGMEFQGEAVQPAIGRWGTGSDGHDVGLPLRRGGSEIGRSQGGEATTEIVKKVYEVVRQLGSGSYAVVYLVRERGGRKREFGEVYFASRTDKAYYQEQL